MKTKIKLIGEVQGTFPGNPTDGTGDLFGVTVSATDKGDVVVAATSASPPNAEGVQQNDAGALYFFDEKKNKCDHHCSCKSERFWRQSQPPFTIPVTNNQVGSVILASSGEWLFSQALGTPLGVESPKDFKGAVLVFRRKCCEWVLHQTLQNPTGIPFSFFGLNLNYDGGKWMVVGGANVTTGYVYKYNKTTQIWEFFQALEPPNPTIPGYVFPAISGNKLVINEPIERTVDHNGILFTYELIEHLDGSEEWIYTQSLTGIDNPIDPIYGNGDFLGNFIDMSGDWILAAASYDNQMGPYTGASYFFHFEKTSSGTKEWVRKQKVFSEDPNVLYGFGLSIDKDMAVIGDVGLTIGSNIFQGAGVVYKNIGGVWIRDDNLLIDPKGRAYDFLGGGGVDLNLKRRKIVLGDDSFSDFYLPPGFPGKRPFPYDPPANDGRAVIYEIKFSC